MGFIWSSFSKTKEVYIHFENKKYRVTFNYKDYNSNRQILLQKLRTKLAKLLKVPATSLKLYQLDPENELSDLGATLESYGLGNRSEILAVRSDSNVYQTPVKQTPSEQINSVMESLDSEFKERIDSFVAAPPADLQQREDEHRILGETVLAKTISLDNIEIDTPEERGLRKQAIAKLQSYHASIDNAMAITPAKIKTDVNSNVVENQLINIPEVVQHDVAKPEAKQPELKQAELNFKDSHEPTNLVVKKHDLGGNTDEVSQVENQQNEFFRSETIQPKAKPAFEPSVEAIQSELVLSESEKPKAESKLGVKQPESIHSQAVEPKADSIEVKQPELDQAESQQPEVKSIPETTQAEIIQPDVKESELPPTEVKQSESESTVIVPPETQSSSENSDVLSQSESATREGEVKDSEVIDSNKPNSSGKKSTSHKNKKKNNKKKRRH